jgi:hypothetical protein
MAYSCKTKRLPTGTSSGLGVPRGSEPPGSANATNTVAFLITTDKEPGAITVGTRGEKDRSPTGRMAYPTSARKLPTTKYNAYPKSFSIWSINSD